TIGLPFAGGFEISDTDKFPYKVNASERGIGVAVMCRTCGERPSVSARRCSTPAAVHALPLERAAGSACGPFAPTSPRAAARALRCSTPAAVLALPLERAAGSACGPFAPTSPLPT